MTSKSKSNLVFKTSVYNIMYFKTSVYNIMLKCSAIVTAINCRITTSNAYCLKKYINEELQFIH